MNSIIFYFNIYISIIAILYMHSFLLSPPPHFCWIRNKTHHGNHCHHKRSRVELCNIFHHLSWSSYYLLIYCIRNGDQGTVCTNIQIIADTKCSQSISSSVQLLFALERVNTAPFSFIVDNTIFLLTISLFQLYFLFRVLQ